MMHFPWLFRPFLRPMVWGGRRLGQRLHKSLPDSQPYGESWEISDHALHQSVLADGTDSHPLRQLLADDADAVLGSSTPTFPWLIKYLDANDWLSVQVHPNDEQAARLRPGERGKTEAWFVLEAEPTSRVYVGLHPEVNESDLRQAAAEGTLAKCLREYTPKPGDFFFLPAGTVHGVGGGVLFAEVQQTSDVTFRLFDWNRTDAEGKSRPLHLEEAIACIDWASRPTPTHIADFAADGEPMQQPLVSCPYFDLTYRRERSAFVCGGTHAMEVWLILHGEAELRNETTSRRVQTGETLLLPAFMPEMTCTPGGSVEVLVVRMPTHS